MTTALISALAALIGVLVGGWITSRNQRLERRHRRFQEQLGFYGIMLGMRMEIRAKSEVRVRIRALSQKAYNDELRKADADLQERQRMSTERWPQYEKGFQYDEQQLREEPVPLYREMLVHWNKNMALVEPSTQLHYGAFVEYVEVWNRALKDALPAEVVWEIKHDEEKLHPLYDDFQLRVTRLREQLKK